MAAMAAMVELGWPILGWSIGGTNPISKAEKWSGLNFREYPQKIYGQNYMVRFRTSMT